MSTLLPDWLAHRALVQSAHPAVAAPEGTLTYAELDAVTGAFAAGIAARGVEHGDRVAILAENCAAFVAAVHGAPRAGATLVPLNARLAPVELAWQIDRVRPRLLVTTPPLEPLAQAALAGCAEPPRLAFAGELAATAAFLPGEPHDGGQVHSIIFTSGTTGRPKGAMLTLGNFWWSAVASGLNLGVSADDRWLAVLPLFHVGGLSIPFRSAVYGTTAVLHPGFDERAVNAAIREGGITVVSVVAAMLQRMLDADNLPFPPSLRCALVGGGPVPRHLLERAAARGLAVVQTYGLTEAASQVATLSPADALAHLGSAGKPLVGTDVRVDAAVGAPGEILVRGPTVTPGYFEEPAATANAIRDGWLHTGDAGILDGEGVLTVLDREDGLIITGGENVYAAEVEAALLAHPAVAQAAVAGLPDERWGQQVAAAVVARGPFDEDEVRAWLRSRLAGYKVPRRIVLVTELPLTASGKVQRFRVRDALLEERSS